MDNVAAFARNCAQNFVAFTPGAREDTLMCYGSKDNGKEFNFRKGAVSLAKKLGVNPADVTLHHIRRSEKYPDSIFNLLDTTRMSEQLVYTAGKYAQEKAIKECVDMALSQNKNRAVLSRVADKGVVKAVEEGLIRPGEMRSYEAFQAKKHTEEEKAEKLGRDVERDMCVRLTFHKTNKVYYVKSFKGDCSGQTTSHVEVVVRDGTGDIVTDATDEKAPETSNFTKKKHHYFYSTYPDYGKTTTATEILQKLNASALIDVNNWMDFDPNSQFIIVDEYGKSNRFAWDDLKRLTSGNASTFGGNRKSYGASLKPRADAQLILFSNYHLFECLGKKKITNAEEDILRSRFHIHKLDAKETRVSETEDGDLFVEEPFEDKYDEDWKSAKRCKYSQDIKPKKKTLLFSHEPPSTTFPVYESIYDSL